MPSVLILLLIAMLEHDVSRCEPSDEAPKESDFIRWPQTRLQISDNVGP